jgi:hypothetical protein
MEYSVNRSVIGLFDCHAKVIDCVLKSNNFLPYILKNSTQMFILLNFQVVL